jgi:uncharacterized membrane protein required for colicin V production
MIESIFLDSLLILVLLLMAAVGAYRGGLREAFSAAGLLLGIVLAQEWGPPWGEWVGRNTSLSDGGGQFAVSVALLTGATVVVGYGTGIAFNYHPGPGGRIFGVVLAAGSALVAVSYLLTWSRAMIFEDEEPQVIAGAYLARFLDGDAGLVLLVIAAAIVGSSIFGAIVKEQDDGTEVEASMTIRPSGFRRSGAGNAAPDKLESESEPRHRTTTVRVQSPQQWDDRTGDMPPRGGRLWSNTWPSDAPGIPDDKPVVGRGDVRRARDRRTGNEPHTDASSGRKDSPS